MATASSDASEEGASIDMFSTDETEEAVDVDFSAMDVLEAPELAFCGARQSVFPNGTLLLDGGASCAATFLVHPYCLPIVYRCTRTRSPHPAP